MRQMETAEKWSQIYSLNEVELLQNNVQIISTPTKRGPDSDFVTEK